MEEKLDSILERLGNLSSDVKGIRTELNTVQDTVTAVKADVESLRESVDSIEADMETRIAALKDMLTRHVDEEIRNARASVKAESKAEMVHMLNDKLHGVDIKALSDNYKRIETELAELRSALDAPFNPDRSVVVYGMKIGVEHTIDSKVDWLLQTILELDIVPKYYEKTEDKGDSRPGVIKIELKNKWDKIALLKAKRKCLDCDAAKHIIIKSCDSHDARVNKINARFFLSKIPDGKNYMVTAHGLIKQKDLPPTDEGGEGSAVAGHDTQQGGGTPPPLGDNTGANNVNNTNATGNARPAADQSHPSTPAASTHEAGRDAANNGSGKRGRGGGSGRGGAGVGRGGVGQHRSSSADSNAGLRSGRNRYN